MEGGRRCRTLNILMGQWKTFRQACHHGAPPLVAALAAASAFLRDSEGHHLRYQELHLARAAARLAWLAAICMWNMFKMTECRQSSLRPWLDRYQNRL